MVAADSAVVDDDIPLPEGHGLELEACQSSGMSSRLNLHHVWMDSAHLLHLESFLAAFLISVRLLPARGRRGIRHVDVGHRRRRRVGVEVVSAILGLLGWPDI
jgi:hypothetical protein